MNKEFPQPESFLPTQEDRLANLNAPQREYAQQLQDKIAALKGSARLKDLSTESLREINRLYEVLAKFLETKEMPEQKEGTLVEIKEAEIDISEYDIPTLDVVDINGQCYFAATKTVEQVLVGPDGKQIGPGYEHIWQIDNLNGRPYIIVSKKGAECIIGPDGQQIGKGYDEVMCSKLIAGQLYFAARQIDGSNSSWRIVGPNGQENSRDYDNVGPPVDVAGQCYFIAEQDKKDFVVGINGDRLSKEYDATRPLCNVGGKYYFGAKQGTKWQMIGLDGKKIGGSYEDIGDPKDIAGQLYFKAKKDGQWAIYDSTGKKFSDDYEFISDPYEINGPLPQFKVGQKKEWFVVGKYGEYIGGYKSIGDLKAIGGECYFAAEKDGSKFAIGPDGEQIGEGYDTVESLTDIGGKCYFSALTGGAWFVIGPNGKPVDGSEFDSIYSIGPAQDNQFYVIGRRDNKLVTELFPRYEN